MCHWKVLFAGHLKWIVSYFGLLVLHFCRPLCALLLFSLKRRRIVRARARAHPRAVREWISEASIVILNGSL